MTETTTATARRSERRTRRTGRTPRRGADHLSDPLKDPLQARQAPDAIGYIGMNEGNQRELRSVEAAGRKGGFKVIGVTGDDRMQDRLSDDTKFDAWIGDFIGKELGITDTARAKQVETVLRGVDRRAIDEMAGILQLFNGAQNGRYTLERLIVSGHSTGSGVYGDQDGQPEVRGLLTIGSDVREVAKAFPGAAKQVEDVMFSACWSVAYITLCQEIFPNLESCWGYTGYSPSAKQGAGKHMQSWEAQTRGRKKPFKGKGSAAVWVKGKGLIAGNPNKHALDDLLEQVETFDNDHFPDYFSGVKERSSTGPLRTFYDGIQLVLNHRGFRSLDASEQTRWKEKKRLVLGLRLYHEYRKKFATDHAGLIGRVGKKLAAASSGYALPDFAEITRGDTKVFIDNARSQLASVDGGAQLYALAQRQLWNLEGVR